MIKASIIRDPKWLLEFFIRIFSIFKPLTITKITNYLIFLLELICNDF